MGRVMLMRKVTRMAEMEGEKDHAAQLLSQVPLEAIFLSRVDCRKDVECWWFDFRGVMVMIQSIALRGVLCQHHMQPAIKLSYRVFPLHLLPTHHRAKNKPQMHLNMDRSCHYQPRFDVRRHSGRGEDIVSKFKRGKIVHNAFATCA